MLLVEVRGSFETPIGDESTGSVELYPRVFSIQSDSEIIATHITLAKLENGAFSVSLQATDAPGFLPTGWTYRVIEKIDGRIWRVYDIAVPSASQGTGIDLVTVAPVQPASGDTSTFVTLPVFTAAITAEATTRAAADTAMAGLYVAYLQAAANPDLLIVGTIVRDASGAATSAPVVWPDGSPGTYTATTVSTAFLGAVDAYTITLGSPVTRTYTQPAVTRDSTGAVTARPAIVVT